MEFNNGCIGDFKEANVDDNINSNSNIVIKLLPAAFL
jgi:hypothetical protein